MLAPTSFNSYLVHNSLVNKALKSTDDQVTIELPFHEAQKLAHGIVRLLKRDDAEVKKALPDIEFVELLLLSIQTSLDKYKVTSSNKQLSVCSHSRPADL